MPDTFSRNCPSASTRIGLVTSSSIPSPGTPRGRPASHWRLSRWRAVGCTRPSARPRLISTLRCPKLRPAIPGCGPPPDHPGAGAIGAGIPEQMPRPGCRAPRSGPAACRPHAARRGPAASRAGPRSGLPTRAPCGRPPAGEPFGKAGAYGIQGLASSFVRRVDGCYFNIVGLPVHRLGLEIAALVEQGEL